MRNKAAGVFFSLGILMIAAAFFWFGYNVASDRAAGEATRETLEKLMVTIPKINNAAIPRIDSRSVAAIVGGDAGAGETGAAEGDGAEIEGAEVTADYPAPDPGEFLIPDHILNPEMPMPVLPVGGENYIGYLTIPSLSLALTVTSDWSYDLLKVSPCRYYGSAYTDDLVIMAHNYSRHFGSIGRLEVGDKVTFTDVDGNVFEYAVALVEILEPTAIEEMTASGFDLTLFTCTIGGQYRVTVRCNRL